MHHEGNVYLLVVREFIKPRRFKNSEAHSM